MNINIFSRKVLQRIMGGFALTMAVVLVTMPSQASAALLYRELQVGYRGSDVSDLQLFLAADPSIYPQGLVTGYFGMLTRAAVSNFQARNGIATVGRVGPITMAAINARMGGGVGYDRTGPVIGMVSVSNVASGSLYGSSASVSMSWNTNENASALVYYSTSPLSMMEASYGSAVTISGTSVVAHTDLRTSHSVTINGLQSNTKYYYVVYVRDASGNESVTWPSSFQSSY